MKCPICGYDHDADAMSLAAELVAQFEGCRLKAYKAVSTEKYYTIGYGHYGPDVAAGSTITEQRAKELLQQDLATAARKVQKYQNYSWTPTELAALTSFAYNVGNIDQLTQNGTRTRQQIASAMLLYNKSGGKVLAGLTRRRQAEQKLFTSKWK